jgi:hypothetical protein
MTNPATSIDLTWEGPYAWPTFETAASLPPLPKAPGIYIQACDYDDGYLIFGVGVTKRPVAQRLCEHTHRYLNGEYNVLDMEAARAGVRREVWHGWGYARAHRDEFESRKIEIQDAVRRQLAGLRIFVADPSAGGTDSRLRERLEAAIMDSLYQQPSPICDLPDRGTLQLWRRADEVPVLIRNQSPSLLHGLPAELLI